MEVVNNTFLPGDPRLIDHIVYELKSQGIFDNFRKECIADVDTKPAYQNLQRRVECSVSGFLKAQKWRSDMNKNHVREMLRKNISESGFLETGVERIVDQVVNPKINTIFLPLVENIIYKVLGITKPTAFDDLKTEKVEEGAKTDLLPNDLEAVSPESVSQEKKAEVEVVAKVEEKIDDEESPPFEPIEEGMCLEENSVDSNLSGISGLVSHDSNHSVENKPISMDTSNQDSLFSKQSSDDRLSIVMSDDQEVKMEINEDSNTSKTSATKSNDTNYKTAEDVPDSSSTEKQSESQEKSDEYEKSNDKLVENKKSDKHRSSHKHSSHKSRHDSRDHKDRKSDREKSRTGEDSKERRDKDRKDRSRSGRDDKVNKSSKERDRTSSNSKHKKRTESEHKDDKPKSESKDSKGKERSKEESKLKSHSSRKSDSKSQSKHNGKNKTDTSKDDKKDDKYKKHDKHSSERKSDKYKDKKDNKKNGKKDKDDHYSQKEKKSYRRSTDRDSSDGHSGTHSSSSSYTDLTSSQTQKSSQQSSVASGSSSAGESGTSDAVSTSTNFNISSIPCVLSEEEHSQILASVPHLKLIKPKFASNISEVRQIMKIRRKLGKLEKQSQMKLMRAINSLNNISSNHVKHSDDAQNLDIFDDNKKTHDNNSHVKSYKYEKSTVGEDNLVEEVQLSDLTELQTSVISKESWDAAEAKLIAENVLQVDYNSYTEKRDDKSIVHINEDDCRGFPIEDQLEATNHLNVLCKVIGEQESNLTKISINHTLVHFAQKDTANEINKLPKIEIVDISSNNEVVFSPGIGIKKIVNDHDVRNNNKVNNKGLGDLLSNRLNDITDNHNNSVNPTPKTKKSKMLDMSVNSLNAFNLPLSPAESDKSFNSVGDKKVEVTDGKPKRNRGSSQRYSSDDLYKPRLQFSTSKRRRITKNAEVD